jgi:hypothetical protein
VPYVAGPRQRGLLTLYTALPPPAARAASREPAPTLKDKERWSAAFHAFLAQALQKVGGGETFSRGGAGRGGRRAGEGTGRTLRGSRALPCPGLPTPRPSPRAAAAKTLRPTAPPQEPAARPSAGDLLQQAFVADQRPSHAAALVPLLGQVQAYLAAKVTPGGTLRGSNSTASSGGRRREAAGSHTGHFSWRPGGGAAPARGGRGGAGGSGGPGRPASSEAYSTVITREHPGGPAEPGGVWGGGGGGGGAASSSGWGETVVAAAPRGGGGGGGGGPEAGAAGGRTRCGRGAL